MTSCLLFRPYRRRRLVPGRVGGVFLLVFFASGCSTLPYNTSVNLADDNQKKIERVSKNKPADAVVATQQASLDVPWTATEACRSAVRKLAPEVRDARPAGPDEPSQKQSDYWGDLCGELQAEADTDFVALTLSGGGMRAAVFASAVIFELRRYGVMDDVDVMSSVSGGSVAAAMYALSCDEPGAQCPPTVTGSERCLWQERTAGKSECPGVYDQLERNLEARWLGNWLWPHNIVKYWFTHFDRSDIMAETLANNYYSKKRFSQKVFRFQDLNPERPSLIINATNFTHDPSIDYSGDDDFGVDFRQTVNFTFTEEEFENICSDFASYPISYAVMASSAFPLLFPYVTLTDYCGKGEEETYVHLFDGGNLDNLGLVAIEYMLRDIAAQAEGSRPDRGIILEVDASLGQLGVPGTRGDPRKGFDFLVDSNVSKSVDSLMLNGYGRTEDAVRDLQKTIWERPEQRDLIHFELRKIKHVCPVLWDPDSGNGSGIIDVSTRYAINEEESALVQQAAAILVKEELAQFCGTHSDLCAVDWEDQLEKTPGCDAI